MKSTFLLIALGCVALGASLSVHAQPAACAPSGGLSFICGVQNAEDLVIVPNTRWLIASGMAPGSGLHAVDTQAKTIRKIYAAGTANARQDKGRFGNCPGPLDPKQMVLHGLALRPAQGGAYTVYATNHGGRESIEVFELNAGQGPQGGPAAAPAATWVGCVLLPMGMGANSVAAFSDGTLVATVLIVPGKTFEDALAGRVTGVVLQWKPGTPAFVAMPGTELSANNGIETSPDDREFFVVSTPTKRVVAFPRNGPWKPLRTAQLQDIGPDNVRWTSDNQLIAAGMIDNEAACGGPPRKEEDIRCPRGYAVVTIDPKTMAVTEVARGPRTASFTGTAMAMRVGNEIWLGSFFADRLAYRQVR
jgi:hypothetical protein